MDESVHIDGPALERFGRYLHCVLACAHIDSGLRAKIETSEHRLVHRHPPGNTLSFRLCRFFRDRASEAVDYEAEPRYQGDQPCDHLTSKVGLQTRSVGFARFLLLSMALYYWIACIPSAQADEPSENKQPRQVSPMLLPQMREFVEQLRVNIVHEGQRMEVQPIKSPLLRSINPERDHHDGTLWAWGREGRPVAFCKIWLRGKETRYWVHEFSSTTTASAPSLAAIRSDRQVWVPQTAGIELKPFEGAAPPGAKQAQRLEQMKVLASRFSAHEFWIPNNTRYDMDLIRNPVHRYADRKSGLIDGGVFVFTYKTAPLVIMFVEAFQLEDGKPAWRYGLAKTGTAEMHVMLDDKDVWSRPRASRRSRRNSDLYYVIDEPYRE